MQTYLREDKQKSVEDLWGVGLEGLSHLAQDWRPQWKQRAEGMGVARGSETLVQ